MEQIDVSIVLFLMFICIAILTIADRIKEKRDAIRKGWENAITPKVTDGVRGHWQQNRDYNLHGTPKDVDYSIQTGNCVSCGGPIHKNQVKCDYCRNEIKQPYNKVDADRMHELNIMEMRLHNKIA